MATNPFFTDKDNALSRIQKVDKVGGYDPLQDINEVKSLQRNSNQPIDSEPTVQNKKFNVREYLGIEEPSDNNVSTDTTEDVTEDVISTETNKQGKFNINEYLGIDESSDLPSSDLPVTISDDSNQEKEPDSLLDMLIDPQYMDAFIQGTKTAISRAGSTFDALTGDNQEIEVDAKEAELLAKNSNLVNKKRFEALARKRYDESEGIFTTIANVSDAMYQEKAGAVEFMAEQAPNTAGALLSGWATAKAGAVAGTALAPITGGASIPVLTVAGFITGMFTYNTLQEVGGKAQEKAGDGLTDAERKDAIREGTVKAGVITAVDTATFGASKWMMGLNNKVVEKVTINTLEKSGINVKNLTKEITDAKRMIDGKAVASSVKRDAFITASERIAKKYQLDNEVLRDTVKLAQKNAMQKVSYVGKKLTTAPSVMALETVGEGLGEYLGELIATGEADQLDAVLEALSGASQSVAQTFASSPKALYDKTTGRKSPIGEQVTADVELIGSLVESKKQLDLDAEELTKGKDQKKIREQYKDKSIVSLFENKDATIDAMIGYIASQTGTKNTDVERRQTAERILKDLDYFDEYQKIINTKDQTEIEKRRDNASINFSKDVSLRRDLNSFVNRQTKLYENKQSLQLKRLPDTPVEREDLKDELKDIPESERINLGNKFGAETKASVVENEINFVAERLLQADPKLNIDQATRKAEQEVLELTTERPISDKGKNLRASLDASRLAPDKKTSEKETVNVYHGTKENAELSNLAERPFKFTDRSGKTRTYKSVEHAYQTLKYDYLLDKKDYKNKAGVIRDQDRIYNLPWKDGTKIKNQPSIDLSSTPVSKETNLKNLQDKRESPKRYLPPRATVSKREKPKTAMQIHQELGGGSLEEFNSQADALMENLIRASAFAKADKKIIENEKGDKSIAPEELSDSARNFQLALMRTRNKKITHNQDRSRWGKKFPEILEKVRKSLTDMQFSNQNLKNKVKLTKRDKVSEAVHKKDQAKADVADKFIGQGAVGTSTNLYEKSFDRQGLSNMGVYKANDTVFVSANGSASNRLKPDFNEIGRAVKAGATIITDSRDYVNKSNYNVGEKEVRMYLANQGYTYNDLVLDDGITVGQWTPKTESLRVTFNAMAKPYIQTSIDPKSFAKNYANALRGKLILQFPEGVVNAFYKKLESRYKQAYDEYYEFNSETGKYKKDPQEFKKLLTGKSVSSQKIYEYLTRVGFIPNQRQKTVQQIAIEYDKFYDRNLSDDFKEGETIRTMNDFFVHVKNGKFNVDDDGIIRDINPRTKKRQQVFFGMQRRDGKVELGQFTSRMSVNDKRYYVQEYIREIIGAVDAYTVKTDKPPYQPVYNLVPDYYIGKAIEVGKQDLGYFTHQPENSHMNPMNLTFEQRKRIYEAYTTTRKGKDVPFPISLNIAEDKARIKYGGKLTSPSSILVKSFDRALNDVPLFRFIIRNKILSHIESGRTPKFETVYTEGQRDDSFTLLSDEYDLALKDLQDNWESTQQDKFEQTSRQKDKNKRKDKSILPSKKQIKEFSNYTDRLSRDENAVKRFMEMYNKAKDKYTVTKVDSKFIYSFKVQSKDKAKKQKEKLENIFGYYESNLEQFAELFNQIDKIKNDDSFYQRVKEIKTATEEANKFAKELDAKIDWFDRNEDVTTVSLPEENRNEKNEIEKLFSDVDKFLALDDTDNKVRGELDRDTEGRDKDQRPTETDKDRLLNSRRNLENFIEQLRENQKTTPLIDIYFGNDLIKDRLKKVLDNYLPLAKGYSNAQHDQEIIQRYVETEIRNIDAIKEVALEDITDTLRREVYEETTNPVAKVLEFYEPQIKQSGIDRSELERNLELRRQDLEKSKNLLQPFYEDSDENFNISLGYHKELKDRIKESSKKDIEQLFFTLADEIRGGKLRHIEEVKALYNSLGMDTPVSLTTLYSYAPATITLADFVQKRGTGYRAKADYFSAMQLFIKRYREIFPNRSINDLKNWVLESKEDRAEYNNWLETELQYIARKRLTPRDLIDTKIIERTQSEINQAKLTLDPKDKKAKVSKFKSVSEFLQVKTDDTKVLNKFLFSKFSLTQLRGFRYLDEKDQYFLSKFVSQPILRQLTANKIDTYKEKNVKQFNLFANPSISFAQKEKNQVEYDIEKANIKFQQEVLTYARDIFKPNRPLNDKEYIEWFDNMIKKDGREVYEITSELQQSRDKKASAKQLNKLNSEYRLNITSPSQITSFKRVLENYKKLEKEYTRKMKYLENVKRKPEPALLETDIVEGLTRAWHEDVAYARKRYVGLEDQFKQLISQRDQQEHLSWKRNKLKHLELDQRKNRFDPIVNSDRPKDLDGLVNMLEDYQFNKTRYTENQLNSDGFVSAYNDRTAFALWYMEKEHNDEYLQFVQKVKENSKPEDLKKPLSDITSSYRLNEFYNEIRPETILSNEPSMPSDQEVPYASSESLTLDEFDNIHSSSRIEEADILEENISEIDYINSLGLDDSNIYNALIDEDRSESKNVLLEEENMEGLGNAVFDKTKFRASVGTRSGVSAGINTKQYVEKIIKNWKHQPKIRIETNIESTKEPLRSKLIQRFGGKGSLKGIYDIDTGEVILFSDNLNDDIRDVEFTIFHEIYGHMGMRGFLGDDFDATLNNLYLTNAKVKKLANEKAKTLNLGRIEAVEEALADMAGKGDQSSAIRRVMNLFTKGLRKIGFVNVARYIDRLTMDELGFVLKSSRDWARERGFVKTYDGTPVDRQAPPSEVFGKIGKNNVGYAVYNAVSDSWTVVHRSGKPLTGSFSKDPNKQEKYPIIHYTVDNYEEAVARMKQEARATSFDENKYKPVYEGDTKKARDAEIFDATDETQVSTMNRWKYRVWQKVQNQYLPVFNAMRKAEKEGKLKNADDLRITLTNYERVVAEKQKLFKNTIVKKIYNLVEDADNLGATREQLNDYLVATTAEERNIQILRNVLPTEHMVQYKRLLTAKIDENGTIRFPDDKEYQGDLLSDIQLKKELIKWSDSADNAKEWWRQEGNSINWNKGINWNGSGMSRQTYSKILEDTKQQLFFNQFQEIGFELDKLGDQKVDMLSASGMISKGDASRRKGAYRHYRTLAGTELEEQADALEDFDEQKGKNPKTAIQLISGAIGRKFNVRGKDKRATGRKTVAQDVLAQTLVNFQTALIRSEKNKIAQQVLSFLQHNRDDNFVKIEENETFKIIDEKGNISYHKDKKEKMMQSPDVFVARVKGKAITMKFTLNEKGSFAESINGFVYPPDQLWGFYQLGRFTKIMGRLVTSWNPFWVPVNFVRDMETVYSNLQIERDMPKGSANKMLSYIFPAMRVALYSSMEDYRPNTNTVKGQAVELARLSIMRIFRPFGGTEKFNYLHAMMKEGRKAGAFTAFLDRENLDDQIIALNNLISGVSQNKPSKFRKIADPTMSIPQLGRTVANLLEGFTIPFEIAPRLATYAVARDPLYGNLDTEKSANLSGEISVNFNMRGSGQILRNSYLFFNPAVQGTGKMVKLAVQSPARFARTALFWIVLGQAMNMIARSLSGEEDDEEGDALEKIPTYKRATMAIFAPDVVGGAVPIAYGWNAFYSIGHFGMDLVLGRTTVEQTIKNISSATFEAFSPIATGVSDASTFGGAFIKAIAPTATQGVAEWWLNENRFGSPIYKDNLFGLPNMSETEMAFRNVNPVSYRMARYLQENTPFNAGNMYNQKGIDINPAMFDHLSRSYLAGALNEGWQSVGRASRRDMGINVTEDQTFLARRFSALVPPRRHIGIYNTLSEKVKTLHEEYENIPDYINVGGESGRNRLAEIEAKYYDLASDFELITEIDQLIKDLTKEANDITADLKKDRLETGVTDPYDRLSLSEMLNHIDDEKKELYKEAIIELSGKGYRDDILPFSRR